MRGYPEQWREGLGPWEIVVEGDRWYGRGTADMKAFSAVVLHLLPQLREAELTEPIHLALSYDEEVGCLGGAHIVKQIADLGSRAKDGNITPDDLTGGTFTITNLGSFGALFDTPIINQPQVAILGTGTIVKRPMVIQDADGNDVVAIRHMCYLSLTYDHRIVDGADAGRFLQGLKARLEEGRFEGSLGL